MQSEGESDMGLALNRFIGNSILPALIKYSKYYSDAESHSPLLEATLHTVYRWNNLTVFAWCVDLNRSLFPRLSKGKMLTNVQRQTLSDFLITLTKEIAPGMLLRLLRKLTVDLANLNEYSNVALRVRIEKIFGLHTSNYLRFYPF